MEIYERIKFLRKSKLQLSQTDFAEKLGVTRAVIKNIELNALAKPEQKEPLYRLVCRVFSVNYEWLKTGKEPIFVQTKQTFIDELSEKYEIDDFLKRAILAYMDLPDESKEAVQQFISSLSGETKEPEKYSELKNNNEVYYSAVNKPIDEMTNEELKTALEQIVNESAHEKGAEEKSSASQKEKSNFSA